MTFFLCFVKLGVPGKGGNELRRPKEESHKCDLIWTQNHSFIIYYKNVVK